MNFHLVVCLVVYRSSLYIFASPFLLGTILAVVDFRSRDCDNEREKYFFINKNSLKNVSIVVKLPDEDEAKVKYSYLQKYFHRHETAKNTVGCVKN